MLLYEAKSLVHILKINPFLGGLHARECQAVCLGASMSPQGVVQHFVLCFHDIIWRFSLSVQASTSTDQAAVARFRAALAAKDEVEAHLESELAAARAQAASYEHRQASSLRP